MKQFSEFFNYFFKLLWYFEKQEQFNGLTGVYFNLKNESSVTKSSSKLFPYQCASSPSFLDAIPYRPFKKKISEDMMFVEIMSHQEHKLLNDLATTSNLLILVLQDKTQTHTVVVFFTQIYTCAVFLIQFFLCPVESNLGRSYIKLNDLATIPKLRSCSEGCRVLFLYSNTNQQVEVRFSIKRVMQKQSTRGPSGMSSIVSLYASHDVDDHGLISDQLEDQQIRCPLRNV